MIYKGIFRHSIFAYKVTPERGSSGMTSVSQVLNS